MPPKKSASKFAGKGKKMKAANTAAAMTTIKAKRTAMSTAPSTANNSVNTDDAARAPRETKASKSSGRSSQGTTRAVSAKAGKRKADIDEEKPTREPKKARVARPRVPKPKPKIIINSAPTTRLNVYVCGEGSSGELGLGAGKTAIDVKRPRLNPHLPADRVGVVQVAVGGMHCVALTHDNKILTWGVNDQGALGRDTTWEDGYKDVDETKSNSDSDSDNDTGLNPHESTPTAIPSDAFPEGTTFVEVAAGDSSSFALTDEGQVYGWGTFRVC